MMINMTGFSKDIAGESGIILKTGAFFFFEESFPRKRESRI